MPLDSPIGALGFKAPDFTLADPDGNRFTMSEHLGRQGLLVAFICNHCPYVKAIAQRLADDSQLLMAEGINVLAVMSNDYHGVIADSPENMTRFAQQHGFLFPYLVDEDQSIAKQYGAVSTPEFFGFNRNGELQYRGRLDNARMNNTPHRVPELVNAMRMIAKTGLGPEVQTASIGCSIKWR
jgi:peroxiredoxin